MDKKGTGEILIEDFLKMIEWCLIAFYFIEFELWGSLIIMSWQFNNNLKDVHFEQYFELRADLEV